MALLDELNAVSTYYWMKTPMGDSVDIVSKASALLYKLMGNAIARNNWEVKNHETVDGGLMIKVPLEYASSNHGAYGPQTVINQSKKKIYDAARFGWGGAYGSNSLDLDDLTKCTGDEAMIDLAKGKIESIKKAIRIDLCLRLWLARRTESVSTVSEIFLTPRPRRNTVPLPKTIWRHGKQTSLPRRKPLDLVCCRVSGAHRPWVISMNIFPISVSRPPYCATVTSCPCIPSKDTPTRKSLRLAGTTSSTRELRLLPTPTRRQVISTP